MRYTGRNTQAISFPLGGIGTGSIGLAGNGMLIDWEIKNRPNKCSNNGFSFFAVKAEKDGVVRDVRVLNGDAPAPYQGMPHLSNFSGYGFGPERCTLAGAPHFKSCAFEGSYPYAKVCMEDSHFPGKAAVEAFNPFIPSNEEDSGIPAAFFTVTIENDTDEDLDYIVAGSLQNGAKQGTNASAARDGFALLFEDAKDVDRGAPEYGNLCIATDAKDCSVQEYWFRGGWFDALTVFWHDFSKAGLLQPRAYEGAGAYDIGTISAKLRVKAGEKGEVRFVIAWSYPNFENYWNPLPEKEAEKGLSNVWKNYYALRYEDARAAAVYALKHWDRLDEETRRFHAALTATTMPEYVLDAVTATMSVLKTPTCLRLPDGSFYGWEGLHSTEGSCEGTCEHVWNYAYAMPFLFPRLERSLRECSYRYNLDEHGGLRFRTMLPLGRAYSDFRPCADGQFGAVMKVYREWKICGDDQWLAKLWPSVKKSVEYAWDVGNYDRWDMNCDGVLEGRQHHTLDMELFGPSSWLNGFYLGALKAAAEMADAMGDANTAAEYRRIYASGRAWTDENLFNGRYYFHKVDLDSEAVLREYGEDAAKTYWNPEAKEIKYQIGEGSSIDQVTGQWHAKLIGLGDILDPEHVASALDTIYHCNFRSMREHFNPCRLYSVNGEKGTVMCVWPEGARKPVIGVPYAEETMYGFEYQAAACMMLYGKIDEGLELVKSIRDRHDGENRNPWNEMECGSNYARSMASYSVLLALSGFEFDMTRKHMGFAPKINREQFCTFWALDDVWGQYDQDERGASLKVLYGQTELRSFSADAKVVKSVSLNGVSLPFGMNGTKIELETAATILRDDCLRVEFA